MDLDNLSQHERELLASAVSYAKGVAELSGKLPTQENFRLFLKCRSTSAERIHRAIKDNKLVTFLEKPKGETLKEENIIEKDIWKVSLPKTRIHTLPQLLEYFQVDMEVWEVKRFIVNKWEMGYIAGSKSDTVKTPACESPSTPGREHTEKQYDAAHHDLYQVKAELVRKATSSVEHYAKENARLLSRLKKIDLQLASERKAVKYLAANHAGYDDLKADIKAFVEVLGDFSINPTHEAPAHAQFMPPVSGDHT